MSLENRVCINSCEEYDSRRIYAVIQEPVSYTHLH